MEASVIAEFLGQLLRSSWQASVLAVVIWLVIKALGENLDARWRCRLWMLVIVRLAWPVSLPSPVSLFNLISWPGFQETTMAGADWASVQSLGLTRFLESAAVQWVWAAVAMILLARLVVGIAWAWWICRTARPINSWMAWWVLQSCKVDSRCTTPITLLESGRVQSPCVLGVFRPRLVLPRGLLGELDSQELRLVFLHELAHLSRRDLALNWVLAAVEIIHWFNPIAWFVTRQLRLEREEDCDARALESQPESGRAYGEVILKLLDRVGWAAQEGVSAAGARILGEHDVDLQPLLHRIHAIRRFRPASRTRIVGFCSWLAMALIGLTDAEPPARNDVAWGTMQEVAAKIRHV